MGGGVPGGEQALTFLSRTFSGKAACDKSRAGVVRTILHGDSGGFAGKPEANCVDATDK